MFKWAGLSIFSEMIVRDGSRNAGNAVDDMGAPLPITAPRNGVGWFAQAGYLLPEIDLEVLARVGALHPIGRFDQHHVPRARRARRGPQLLLRGAPVQAAARLLHVLGGRRLRRLPRSRQAAAPGLAVIASTTRRAVMITARSGRPRRAPSGGFARSRRRRRGSGGCARGLGGSG